MTISGYTIPRGKYDEVEAHDECAVYPPNAGSSTHDLHGVMISRYTYRRDVSDADCIPIEEEVEYETVFGATPLAVVSILQMLELEFAADDSERATMPDGSRLVHPGSDRHEEIIATPFGFSAQTIRIIREATNGCTVIW